MSNSLHLVAHIVAGRIAFDIASRICDDCDPAACRASLRWDEADDSCIFAGEWAVPSSGTRCYPFWSVSLAELGFVETSDGWHYADTPIPSVPANHPWFYLGTPGPAKDTSPRTSAAANLTATAAILSTLVAMLKDVAIVVYFIVF